jgi:hypothetical protein
MNYKCHYDNLIRTRKILNRKKYNGSYYEDHHIIMKSMGGTDDKNNRLLLTAKEHYIAHYLLWKIYKNSQTALSFLYMCNDGNKTGIKISSRLYEEIRIECSKISSKNLKSQWNNPETRKKLSISNSIKNKGRKHNDESRKNMSEAHKGIKPSQNNIEIRRLKMIGRKLSQETIDKIVSKTKGQKRSDELKRKLSEAAKHRKISKETKLEMSRKMSELKKKPRKQYKLVSPNNIEYIFDGLKIVFKFAEENKLSINLLKDFFNKGKVISKSKCSKNSENWEFSLLKKI